ncbi:MAG: methylated-DNA--[protein]-cysteine S-methyltransferase [Firmicutes bacterium]|nr:methylated-DNA--[protein]-cysteine S-methyltransferase [Bacillota bacterium]
MQNLTRRIVLTQLGLVTLAYSQQGLYALDLPSKDPSHFRHVSQDDPPWVQLLAQQLQAYFRGEKVKFTCPIDFRDYPPFFRRVLQETQKIAYGAWRSYGWLAAAVQAPGAARAVGQAMARNRTPVVIPCHRVLRSDGTLGGFSGGLSWKERLLALEKAKGGD